MLTANGDEDFTVTLGTPNSVVGFNAYTNTFGPAVIQVFGGGGLLGTFSLAQDPTMVGFFGVVASQPIASFRWTTTNGAQVNTGIDNLRVGIVTAVPEPSIIAMLCTGILTGAIGMRRRFSSGASARPALA